MGVHLEEVLTLNSYFIAGVGLAGGPQAGAITWIITGCFLRRPFSAFECDPKSSALGASEEFHEFQRESLLKISH